MEQKFKDIDQVRREYPNMIQLFKNSSFPPEIITGLSRTLDYFGEAPLIVRSSSLLEDRFGTAFSGKYKSLFLANQGDKKERLEALQDAVAEVWASVLGPDPIEYRRERGLQEFVEQMGILVQEVIGTQVGRWWLPAFAGVAFSHNELRWSARIRREDGLVRLVPGLGTRAVDRVGDDFPVLAVPGQPGLRVNQAVDEVLRYCPLKADAINLETNTFETVDLEDLLHEAGNDYPLVGKVFSVLKDGRLQQVSRLLLDPKEDELVADMERLLAGSDFIPMIHKLLKDAGGVPGHTGGYRIRARRQGFLPAAVPAPGPVGSRRSGGHPARDPAQGSGLLRPPATCPTVWSPASPTWSMWFPNSTGSCRSVRQMLRVGRAVGRLNQILPRRAFILLGPGRWGSRGDIKMGVSVTYADISNTAMLIEIARQKGNYVPDLSFGTHFFQDLVEADIKYLPFIPTKTGWLFQEAGCAEHRIICRNCCRNSPTWLVVWGDRCARTCGWTPARRLHERRPGSGGCGALAYDNCIIRRKRRFCRWMIRRYFFSSP